MTPTKTATRAKRSPAHRPLPPEERVATALFRLHKERAIRTVIRGTLPLPLLRRLLRDTIPKREAAAMPDEVWSAMAANVAAESADYGLILGQALHDRLAWDQEPASPEEWERMGQERPLEALWMAALSESKGMRKGFAQFAAGCLKAYQASPASRPPSWEFVEEILTVHGSALQDLRDAERDLDDAERRHEAERQRSDDLRDELKRLRRETSELRTDKALAEKKAAAALEAQARAREAPADAQRFEELGRRLRKAEKENEHLRRELERTRLEPEESGGDRPVAELEPDTPAPAEPAQPPLSEDPNERRRVMRQMLRKLFKKGKIGASHTHEDNVFRGVPDHAKGTAKAIIDLLYREGVLMPKPTTTDPHVSLSPERTAEVRAIIAGTIENPRLRRFVEESE